MRNRKNCLKKTIEYNATGFFILENDMKKIRIAIDGPAGAGKSSVSRMVAQELGFMYVDTGAMYRAVAFAVTQSEKEYSENLVKEVLKDINLSFKIEKNENKIFLNNEDISNKIRTPQTSMMASKVAVLPFVREALFEIQQNFAKQGGIVMEGRDIGTVIIPDAELKIFLTASAEKRAKRRLLELEKKGETKDLNELIKEIEERDAQDRNRKTAPLKQADDAILLDNSEINLEQTAQKIVELALEIIDKK